MSLVSLTRIALTLALTLSAYIPPCEILCFLRYSPEPWPRQLAAGGDDGNRTHDPLLAGQVLSQLSYTPIFGVLNDRRSLKIEQQ